MPQHENPYAALAALAARPSAIATRDAIAAKRERAKAAAIPSTEARAARNAALAASIVASIAFRSTVAERGDYARGAASDLRTFNTKRD